MESLLSATNSGLTVETPADVSRLLVKAYPTVGLSALLIRWRPYICPFHELLKSVPVCGSVLDVGCGVGLMSLLLAWSGRVKRIVGIDASERAIETASSAVLPEGCEASFRCVSESDPWPDEVIDHVLCIDVLHHVAVSKQREFIKSLSQLNFRGKIIFKDVSPRPFWMALASRAHDLLISRQWIHIRNEEEVKQWFEEENLSVIGPCRMDTLWYSHYLLLVERRRM